MHTSDKTNWTSSLVSKSQETIDLGNRQKKDEINFRKIEKRIARSEKHRDFTESGIPRRVNGNKLGLAKREKLFLEVFDMKKELENG